MTTVLDQPQVMTHDGAENEIREWESKLSAARNALAETEQGIGTIALAEGVQKAIERATRLQVEVKMCETGLAAATSQRDEVRRCERLAYAQTLREQAAELEAQAEEHAAFYNEWGPKVANAHDQMVHKSNRAFTMQRQADEIERKYGKVTA